MGAIVVLLLLAVAAAAVVIVYAAYPYRGQDTPVAPGIGRAMRRGVESLPTVPAAEDRHEDREQQREASGSSTSR